MDNLWNFFFSHINFDLEDLPLRLEVVCYSEYK